MKRILSLILILICCFSVSACKNEADYIQVTHIIDAATGMPYNLYYDENIGRYENKSDSIISATIISDDSAKADAYATSVCVMGFEEGIKFLSENNIDAILFTLDKRMAVVGDISINESKYKEYTDYELCYGHFAKPTGETIEADYNGEYTFFNGSIFALNMEYSLSLSGGDARQIKEMILKEWEEIENSVSLTKSDSDLNKLNEAEENKKIRISETTYEILSIALEVWRSTSGAFNPAVVGLSKLWNVDIEGINTYKPAGGTKASSWHCPDSLPTREEIEAEMKNCNMDDLILETVDGKYYASKRNASLKMDMGGIAKGYAVDRAKEICLDNGVTSAVINISGNIYLINSRADGKVQPWTVDITSPTERNPYFRDIIMEMFLPGNVTVVTSGDYQRFYFYRYDK